MKIQHAFIIGVAALALCACGGGAKPASSPAANMTESYAKARAEFKAVTGIEVPALANLEADEFPYQEGATDYCFDIVSGSALNYETYMVFEEFFLGKLGSCMENFPTGNEEEGRDAQWTVEARWYQTMWDATNHAIYINTYIPG